MEAVKTSAKILPLRCYEKPELMLRAVVIHFSK
jgi:hypothetical protein